MQPGDAHDISELHELVWLVGLDAWTVHGRRRHLSSGYDDDWGAHRVRGHVRPCESDTNVQCELCVVRGRDWNVRH